MNAVSAPTCICPLSTRWAPNQSTATVEALKMSMTIGKTSAMSRPTASAVPVYWVLASAKRARSWSSRTNARTTRMPVICSRRTRLTQSTDSCMSRKLGIIRRMTSDDAEREERHGDRHEPGQPDVLAQRHDDAADHHDRGGDHHRGAHEDDRSGPA